MEMKFPRSANAFQLFHLFHLYAQFGTTRETRLDLALFLFNFLLIECMTVISIVAIIIFWQIHDQVGRRAFSGSGNVYWSEAPLLRRIFAV